MQTNLTKKHFASDNYSGVHPEIMQALMNANVGHTAAYGYDEYTARLDVLIGEHFGEQAVGYPVFNGTGANVLGLQSLMPRFGSVICAESAHINQDESNAPQAVGGFKLWTIPTPDGKLTPELIQTQAHGFDSEHRSQPAVVYISQTTECGTCYTIDEIAKIADTAHQYGMKLFVDGARLSNAVSFLQTNFEEMITKAGVDMVSLGGTKNGLMFGECLIDVKGVLSDQMKFLRKMNMQTASKMRFISAQLVCMLEKDLYRTLGTHANQMAQLLADELNAIGVPILYKVESNAVFVRLPKNTADQVRQHYAFYDWQEGVCRLMCSFDTTPDDVMDLARLIKQATSSS